MIYTLEEEVCRLYTDTLYSTQAAQAATDLGICWGGVPFPVESQGQLYSVWFCCCLKGIPAVLSTRVLDA